MNTEERRQLNTSFLRIFQDYISNFHEYQENVTDYNRNVSRMMNLIANISNVSLSTSSHTQPRRSNFEYDLLSYLLATSANTPINRINRGLTNTTIENNTRMISYSENMQESICPITHTPFEPGEQVCQIIHCGHYFKRESIMRWFEMHNTCPTCRYVIRESRENFGSNNSDVMNNNNNINNSLQNGLDSFARIVNTTMQEDPSFNTISYTFDIPFNHNNN